MQTYPVSKDKNGVYWMSNKDITKALGYKVETTIRAIVKKYPKEFTEPYSTTHFTIGAVRTICKHSTHYGKARQLSDYLLQFAQQQIQTKGENVMLKKIQTRPYPIYKNNQGTLWMSSPDLVKLFRYASKSGITHIIRMFPNPSVFDSMTCLSLVAPNSRETRFYTTEAVIQFCQTIEYKRPWVKDLAEHLQSFSKPVESFSYKKIAEDLKMVVAHSKTPAISAIQFIIQEKGIKDPVDWIKRHGYPTQIGDFNVEYLNFRLDWDNLGKSPEYKENLGAIMKLSQEIKGHIGRRNSFLVDRLCEAYGYMMGVEALAAFKLGNGVA